MSEFFSDAPAELECSVCGKAIRPQRSKAADYPLGAVIGRAGKCNTCYRRDLAEMDLAADSWVRPVLAPNPLHSRLGMPAESTPNPYTCPCGYRVITHTTPTASRYHKAAARQHARECRGAA